MLQMIKRDRLQTIELTERVAVRTHIAPENHAALRAGFVGCPANPRWSVNKYCAWKLGCQWRAALERGDMVVSTHDSLLVRVSEQEESPDEEPPSPCRWSNRRQSFHFVWTIAIASRPIGAMS